jgi:SHS2 domain-containing protein
MNKDFEILEHTADVAIRAFGEDMAKAFVNAAKAMFSLITDPASIREIQCREVNVKAPDREILLVEWLNELIYLFDTEQMLLVRFEILSLSDTNLFALCWGEKADLSRHEIKIGIKSATYHMLKIEHNRDWQVQVLFDI